MTREEHKAALIEKYTPLFEQYNVLCDENPHLNTWNIISLMLGTKNERKIHKTYTLLHRHFGVTKNEKYQTLTSKAKQMYHEIRETDKETSTRALCRKIAKELNLSFYTVINKIYMKEKVVISKKQKADNELKKWEDNFKDNDLLKFSPAWVK